MQEETKQVRRKSILLDGGWGWMIVMASFMCNAISEGIVYSFGAYLPILTLHFDKGKGKVAWVGSFLAGLYLICGPIASILIKKYGCWTTCVIGSVIAVLSFVLSTFSNSLYILMFLYGICGGLGLGLIYLPANVCVGQYFDKKLSLAIGITNCGSGVGCFFMPPLTAYLIDQYGWKGANLIIAGLIFNCVPFGILMRPSRLLKKKAISLQNHDQQVIKETPIIFQNGLHHTDDRNKEVRNEEVGELSSTTSDNSNDQQKNGTESRLKQPSFLKNPAFYLICFSFFVGELGFLIPDLYIIDVAMTKGIEYEAASFLVSMTGVATMVGTLFFGYISDLPSVNIIIITYICTAFSSAVTFCVPLCSNYIGFSVIAVAFTIFTTPYTNISSILLVKLLGVSELVHSFGIFCLLDGIASIIGIPIAGWLFDWTENYQWSFWAAGIFIFISAVLLVITSLVSRFLERKERKSTEA